MYRVQRRNSLRERLVLHPLIIGNIGNELPLDAIHLVPTKIYSITIAYYRLLRLNRTLRKTTSPVNRSIPKTSITEIRNFGAEERPLERVVTTPKVINMNMTIQKTSETIASVKRCAADGPAIVLWAKPVSF